MSRTLILEAEAHKYLCPYLDRDCKGSKCMKWEWFYKQAPSNTPTGFISPPNMVKTDKGSCGA